MARLSDRHYHQLEYTHCLFGYLPQRRRRTEVHFRRQSGCSLEGKELEICAIRLSIPAATQHEDLDARQWLPGRGVHHLAGLCRNGETTMTPVSSGRTVTALFD